MGDKLPPSDLIVAHYSAKHQLKVCQGNRMCNKLFHGSMENGAVLQGEPNDTSDVKRAPYSFNFVLIILAVWRPATYRTCTAHWPFNILRNTPRCGT